MALLITTVPISRSFVPLNKSTVAGRMAGLCPSEAHSVNVGLSEAVASQPDWNVVAEVLEAAALTALTPTERRIFATLAIALKIGLSNKPLEISSEIG